MTKIFTHTEEIEHCGECASCDYTGDLVNWRCAVEDRSIGDLWGKIPKFCPLPEKREE